MTQPTALYLADLLEDAGKPADIAEKAAAELRRLHAELERCKQVCAATSEGWRSDTDVWKAQRDALLEALRLLNIECHQLHHNFKDRHDFVDPCPVVARIKAAIKAAEENT